MPNLDMSDVLSDPDFLDDSLQCQRNAQTIGDDGIAINNYSYYNFSAVVTSFGGDELKRTADGEYISQTIQLVTRFRLTDGGTMGGNIVYTADIISWNGGQYTIVQVDDYTRYGRGFIQAVGQLVPLDG